MWTALATNVVSAVASHYFKSNTTTQNSSSTTQISNSGPDNYNVTGYIDNIPVELQVERSSSSSARPKRNLRSFESNEISNRSLSIPQQLYSGSVPTCQNCSTSKPSNKKTQNEGNDNKLCRIALPSEGNYDVRIRKTDSNFAAMKISDKRSFKSNGTQNKQYGNQNKQSADQNKPNRNQNKHNGNCNNCNGNHNRQNGNYNKQTANQNKQNENYNKQTGNQNKHNRNYNNQTGNQNKQNENYNNQTRNQNGIETKQNLQSKPQIKNRKPGELKLGKGIQSNRQVKYGNFGDLRSRNGYQSTWMYVGRLKQGTTETDLRIYLEAMFRGYDFIVETLPLYKNAKLPCFKVRVDNSILAEFKKADSWPNGATVTEFIENFKS